ncbi:MAG: hypothetical protein QOI64_139 [Solirubrobacteraceae bacterium]|nr:hypothetical protein [Solirubrobacteraceae bacterium]
MFRKPSLRLDYPTVMSTLAVFIALGGTSYALTLPRNSVGAAQIRPGAVGSSELRVRAVRSKQINDHSVALRDVSFATRRALRGQRGSTGPAGPPGPPGIAYSVAINSGGGFGGGNGSSGGHQGGSGIYEVRFDRDMTNCRAVATLSRVPGGGTVDPPSGEITTATHATGVTVKTYNSGGMPDDLPFHLIAVC